MCLQGTCPADMALGVRQLGQLCPSSSVEFPEVKATNVQEAKMDIYPLHEFM